MIDVHVRFPNDAWETIKVEAQGRGESAAEFVRYAAFARALFSLQLRDPDAAQRMCAAYDAGAAHLDAVRAALDGYPDVFRSDGAD